MARGQDTRFNLKRRITKLVSSLDAHAAYREERHRQDTSERIARNKQSTQENSDD